MPVKRWTNSDRVNASGEKSINTLGESSAESGEFGVSGFDILQLLEVHPGETFYFRMNGEAMAGAGIQSGDILVVDRLVTQPEGRVVIAVLNGEVLVRRLEKRFNKLRLVPETSCLAPIEVDLSSADFYVWGVVTYTIRSV